MNVREIMTEEVGTCSSDETCSAAVKIMWDCDCGIVPIIDSGRRVVGAITDRDIAIACWSRDCSPGQIRIEDCMTRDVHCCSPGDRVGKAERLMEGYQVRRLPVEDSEGCLCGIVSLADIARRSEPKAKGSAQADIRPEKVVEAYAAVCQPRNGRQLHA